MISPYRYGQDSNTSVVCLKKCSIGSVQQVKFSVKSSHPISTSSLAVNCRFSWESAAVVVDYLFMGQGQITDKNQDYGYTKIISKSIRALIYIESGGYRPRKTVPM